MVNGEFVFLNKNFNKYLLLRNMKTNKLDIEFLRFPSRAQTFYHSFYLFDELKNSIRKILLKM